MRPEESARRRLSPTRYFKTLGVKQRAQSKSRERGVAGAALASCCCCPVSNVSKRARAVQTCGMRQHNAP
jgi:hypothetical protein